MKNTIQNTSAHTRTAFGARRLSGGYGAQLQQLADQLEQQVTAAH